MTTEDDKQTNRGFSFFHQQLVAIRPLAGLTVDTHCRFVGPADVSADAGE